MLLELKHIYKNYLQDKIVIPVLKDVNISIDEGEYVAIMGPSGSGKTTLMNIIGCLDRPTKGEFLLEGESIVDYNENRLSDLRLNTLGFVFQSFNLLPKQTALDNVALPLSYAGIPVKKRKEIAFQALKRVGLADRVHFRPSQLSGGQQQRVALARMMIGEPEAILLDEPFSALDGYLKDVLQKDMQEFLKQYQGDMLMVTHSRDEAFRFCNELMLLKDGKTLIFGDTRKLFEQPQLLEAARLTGCKNSSRIERMGEYQVFALDWGISLRTEQKVELDMTHIAIRGHWIRPSEKAGENCLVFEAAEYVETTFEHQYLVKSPGMEDGAVLWWMRPKKSFTDEHDKNLPKYLYLPPEHLMLLK